MNLNGIAADFFGPAVDRVFKLLTGKHRARPLQQHLQQRKLACGQVDRLALQAHLLAHRVQHEPTAFEQRRGAAGVAAQQGANAGDQFIEIKWFEYVVVSPGIEPGNSIGDRVARGDDQNRNRIAATSQQLQHRHAVLPRKAQIQQRQIVNTIGQRAFGRVAVHHPVNRKTGVAQSLPDRAADHGVVFNEKQAHGVYFDAARQNASAA